MIDPDIQTHMLATYVGLRRLIIAVTIVFLVSLSLYRWLVKDPGDPKRETRNSISAYYHHDNSDYPIGDMFVGVLTTAGLLLIAYQGYTDRENWALNVAGVSLLGVVVFPLPPDAQLTAGKIAHGASAVIFFVALAYICLRRARDTLDLMKDEKLRKLFEWLYLFLGGMMLSLPLVWILVKHVFHYPGYVFVVEYVGVYVFLVYWIVKGVELRKTQLETEAKIREVAAYAKSNQ